MANNAVYLSKLNVKRGGKTYSYWRLQWLDANGKNQAKTIGSTGKLSKRQAEKIRRQKEHEFGNRPGLRNVSKSPSLEDYLNTYLRNRKSELSLGTIELHKQTTRYLLGFFSTVRRIDSILRPDARAFKAALAAGELAHVNKRKVATGESTVNIHIRNATVMFNFALNDDLVLSNPFNRLAGKSSPSKTWHEVADSEFQDLMAAARFNWRLLLGMCRYAALRRGEALNLRWNQIDWERSRITIIANNEWQPKDREFRVVPIVPELRSLLLEAFELADEGQEAVIPKGAIKTKNISRDFTVLCKQASVKRYQKPLHTLRKTCQTVWARHFPKHVVAAWAGHSSAETTREFYLQVSELEYNKAAGIESEKKAKSEYLQ